ncbi:MAG TPA: PAS domain S-box protein, partial [Allocoleopsis sp.]
MSVAPSGNRRQIQQAEHLQSWLMRSKWSRHLAASVTLTYALFSLLWIGWSDQLLMAFVHSTQALTALQTFKGWFFVCCTSLLLYGLIRRGTRQLQHQHQLLQSIINSTKDSIFVKDLQGRYVVVNQTAAQALGGHPTDILGKLDEQFFGQEEAQRIRVREQAVVKNGKSVEIEELLTLHGEKKWFSTTKSLCLDNRSHPIGIVGIARDVTQRKQAEAVLRDNEERLRLALTAAQQGLYDLNVQTGETIVNAEYATMLGYDPAELQETNARWIERLHPDDWEQVARVYQAYLAGEIPVYQVEFRQKTKNGDWKWILSLGKIVAWDEAGQPLRMLGTHTDISDRKRLEAEQQQTAAERWRAEKLRIEFKLLENILEVILAGYWDWNVAKQETYFSPTWKRMFGYEDQELPNILETWQQLMLPEDLTRSMQSLNQHIQSRGQMPFCNEVRYRHKNGSTIWVICSGRVIEWDADGNPLRVIGCHIDITARKQAEEALRESERRYATLTEAAPVAICQFDAAGYCIYANERWGEMTGQPTETALGMGWLQTLPPEDRDRTSEEWFQSLHQNQRFQNERRCLRPDGSIAWFYAQVLPEIDANDRVVGYIGTLTDITDRKKAEQTMQLANVELARATRLKDEFLANMSHELRTPLTAILGMSDMLQQEMYGALNDKQHQYLEVISQSGNHLLTLINDILDLARIESGKLELEVRSTSIKTLCQVSLNFIKQIAHQKHIQLETRILAATDAVNVDERRMRQALINLLSNAVKFTPDGGQVTLEIRRNDSQQTIQFCVIDTGIGIAAEDRSKLFQAFVQVDSKLNRHYGGTGLGLALVKQIVELHHGTIEVTS